MTQLRLSMSKKWLDRYFGENKSTQLFNKNGAQLLSYQPISSQGIMAAQQLLACNVSREVKRVFMHGQAMSILASELSHLYGDSHRDSARFSPKDRAIARLAQDILFMNLKPSVSGRTSKMRNQSIQIKKIISPFLTTRLMACCWKLDE
jgi:hypothetical protein